jgi:ABC-2 type transport system ATP-binding protein
VTGDTTFGIEVEGLCKRYGEFDAVRDLTFKVGRGEVVGFLGTNGAGKTTTMRMLTGFIPPTNGTVRIDGHDIFDEGLAARRAIGYLPESPPVYPEMTVRGYLRFVAGLKDVPRGRRKVAVERAIKRCGLADSADRVIGHLSKGYRQRVGLAQAIVHDPKVLVLDEPTVGLDPIQIREIRGLIQSLARSEGDDRGHTVILSTHILPEVEALCDRVVLIHRGEMALDKPLDELTAGGETLEEVFTRVSTRDAAAEAEGAA